MSFLYHTLIAQPIINAMVLLYNYFPIKDLGITIILLTILIRLLLLPLSYKAARTQRTIAKIQPELKEIQQKYKENREEQAKKLMELYKTHKINPLSGIVPLLIQLPVLFALYRAFMLLIKGTASVTTGSGALTTATTSAIISGSTTTVASLLYSFVANPGTVNPMFLGLVDLSKANIPLAITAGALQFIFSKMTMIQNSKNKQAPKKGGPMSNFGSMMGTQMTYMLPIFTVLIAWGLPAGLPLYWIITTLFSIGEQFFAKRNQEKQSQALATNQKA